MSVEETLGKIILIPFFIIYILLLSKPRYSRRITMILAPTVILFYFIMNYLIIRNFYYLIDIYPISDLLFRIGNTILMIAFALSLTKQRIVQSVFITASDLLSINIVGVFAMAILINTGVPELPVRIVLHIILGVFLFWARKPFLEFLNRTNKGWWLLCTVPFFLIANFLFITSIPVSLERNPDNLLPALILCGTTIITYISFVYILRMMYTESRLEQNIKVFRMSMSALEHQNEIIAQNAQKMALFRHDLRHIAQMMSTCLDRDDMDGVRDLLEIFYKNTSNAANIGMMLSVTGHKLLDGTLSYYVNFAKESGIDITIAMEEMDNVEADKTELAVVVSNALENAVHECEKLPDNEKRIMRVNGSRRGNQFFLEIANTCTGKATFDPDTGLPLSNRDGHGLGSQSIAFFAQKYGAVLEYQQTNGWFYVRLLL